MHRPHDVRRDGLYRLFGVMRRGRRAGEIVNFVDLGIELVTHVVVGQNLKTRVILDQMAEIFNPPGGHIVDAD